ncbi:MAG TPA: hypothetical protein VFB84_03600 [Micromonosporaceae bacterium]|nr:hypothetical protein [Micromonosporaceae bacterium]
MRTAPATIAQAVNEYAATAVWALPDDELVDALGELHVLMQRLAAVNLALVRELDGRGPADPHPASHPVRVWPAVAVTGGATHHSGRHRRRVAGHGPPRAGQRYPPGQGVRRPVVYPDHEGLATVDTERNRYSASSDLTRT